jgi:hypothetical protein
LPRAFSRSERHFGCGAFSRPPTALSYLDLMLILSVCVTSLRVLISEDWDRSPRSIDTSLLLDPVFVHAAR